MDGRCGVESAIVPEDKQKPAFDEQTLAKLLEAAFVLQEHGDQLRGLKAQSESPANEQPANVPQAPGTQNGPHAPAAHTNGSAALASDDYSTTLGHIAEVQHQIEARPLAIVDAMALIANTLTVLCGAAGAAVAMLNGKEILYSAVAGSGCLPVGSSVPPEKAFCSPCIRTGQVLRCSDTNADPLLDANECVRRGIHSFIAVPIFQDGGIAGGIELYYADPSGFREKDIQSCQLMAAIVTEALAREGKLARPATATVRTQEHKVSTSDSLPLARCHKCGHELVAEEQFCGECGALRSDEPDVDSSQRKVASLWHVKQAAEPSTGRDQSMRSSKASPDMLTGEMDNSELADELPIDFHALLQSLANASEPGDESNHTSHSSQEVSAEESSDDASQKIEATPSADWSSALSAREFLQQVAEAKRQSRLVKFWNEHRGDIYLGIAVVLVICVIRWGLWTNNPVNATTSQPAASGSTHKVSAPELSFYDRMLIHLGLAEAPAPPEDKGNPATAVWVDVTTGLYYCPGTDLYGNTPKGKYTAQRDAQLDRFEPAYRKVCN